MALRPNLLVTVYTNTLYKYLCVSTVEFSYIKSILRCQKKNVLTMSPISPVSMASENREKFKRNILLDELLDTLM